MNDTPLPWVLVVDDEEPVRRVIARELRGRFEAVLADGLAQASAALERYPDLVAVVSDLDLGRGTTGLQVFDEVRRRCPAAVRILISGRAHPDDVAEPVRSGLVGRFVQKPWTVGALREILAEALAEGRIQQEDPVQQQAPTGSQISDALPLVREGDEEATVALFLQWRRLLLWRIHNIHGVAFDDAEDVLQETYERFLPYPIRLEHPRRLLLVIAETVAMDYHRRRAAEGRALEGYAVAQGRRRGDRAEERMLARLDIGKALAGAKGRCYELLTTVLLQGLTHTEYAEETGTARGTIGSALTRCLDKVRRHLVRQAQHNARVRHARNA